MLNKNWEWGRTIDVCMCIDPLYSISEVAESAGLNKIRTFTALSITICVTLLNQLNHTELGFPIWG